MDLRCFTRYSKARRHHVIYFSKTNNKDHSFWSLTTPIPKRAKVPMKVSILGIVRKLGTDIGPYRQSVVSVLIIDLNFTIPCYLLSVRLISASLHIIGSYRTRSAEKLYAPGTAPGKTCWSLNSLSRQRLCCVRTCLPRDQDASNRYLFWIHMCARESLSW